MPALLDRSRSSNAKHYFYGGAPGVADRLAERMQAAYPGLDVVGTYSPPFGVRSAEEEAADVAQINAAHPDYVWVGLGAPKQDLWAARHRPQPDAAAVLAVGAAFDFHSGGLSRAPAGMQRRGLEWLYRLGAEPRRLARRYLVTNTRFCGLVGTDPVVRRAPAAQATSLTRCRSIEEGQRPSARSIAGIVRRMIMMSSHGDQRSMYSRSFLTQ